MSNNLSVSVGKLQSPTSKAWNDIVAGIMPAGVYSGGSVVPGDGLNVKVEPFIARNSTATIRLEGADYYIIGVPQAGQALYLIARTVQSVVKAEYVELAFVTASQLTLDDSVTLAEINVPLGAIQITADMIDTSMVVRKSLDSDQIFGMRRTGTGTFKTANVITHNLGKLSYTVGITPLTSQLSIGDILVEKDLNSFTVTNTGPSVSDFDWSLDIESDVPPVNGIVYGQIEVGDIAQVINHGLTDDNYFPAITPLTAPTGPYWVVKQSGSFTVQTSGQPFRAMWAAIPTQSSHTNGLGDYSTGSISHGLGNTDFAIFTTSFSSNQPTKPVVFTKTNNSVTWDPTGLTGQFQFVIVPYNTGLVGQVAYGQKADHLLNREDYVPLIRAEESAYTSITCTRNSIYANEEATLEYYILPSNNSWALGDWTRPASSPVASRIEILGTVENTAGITDIVHREVIAQNNYISRGILRLAPVQPLTYDVGVTLAINGQVKAELMISAGGTADLRSYVPFPVSIGDIAEVRLSSQGPTGEMVFNFFGMGDIILSGDSGGDFSQPPALRIVRVGLYPAVGGQDTWTVPEYIPTSNNLTFRVDDRDLLITKGEYTEVDKTTIKTAKQYFPGNLVEVEVISQLYLQAPSIGPDPGITAQQASYIEQTRIGLDSLTQQFDNYVANFSIQRADIEKLKYLDIDINGTLTGDGYGTWHGDVLGNAAGLTGLNYSVSWLNGVLKDLTSGSDSELHWHASDRDRANHTGTQTLATISDAGTMAAVNVGSNAGQAPVLDAQRQFPLAAVAKAQPTYWTGVATNNAMTNLAAKRGDYAEQNGGGIFLLTKDDPTVLGNWQRIASKSSSILSVNSMGPDATGNVNVNTTNIPDFQEGVDAILDAELDDRIANNPAVEANTAKVTNATHTGEVTGSQALTITQGAVTSIKLSATGGSLGKVLTYDPNNPAGSGTWGNLTWTTVVRSVNGVAPDDNGAVTIPLTSFSDFSSSVETAIENSPTIQALQNPTPVEHTGQVTGTTALTIADNVVALKNLLMGTGFVPINGQFIKIDLTAPGGLTQGESDAGSLGYSLVGGTVFAEDNGQGGVRQYMDFDKVQYRFSLSSYQTQMIQNAIPDAPTIVSNLTGANFYTSGTQSAGVAEGYVTWDNATQGWVGTGAPPAGSVAKGTFVLRGTNPATGTSYFGRWNIGASSGDGAVGIILHATEDDNGGWQFISLHRSLGGVGWTCRIYLNYGAPDQVLLADYTTEFAWGNGGMGATAAAAGYTVGSKSMANFVNSGCFIEVNRRGTLFDLNMADFTTVAAEYADPVVKMTVDLDALCQAAGRSGFFRGENYASLGVIADVASVGTPFWRIQEGGTLRPYGFMYLSGAGDMEFFDYNFSARAWDSSAGNEADLAVQFLKAGHTYICDITGASIYAIRGDVLSNSYHPNYGYQILNAGKFTVTLAVGAGVEVSVAWAALKDAASSFAPALNVFTTVLDTSTGRNLPADGVITTSWDSTNLYFKNEGATAVTVTALVQ